MSAPIEIGDIVRTADGVKMVVNIFRNLTSKQIELKCVDAEDVNNREPLYLVPKMYSRLEVDPVIHLNRYSL